MAIAIAGLSGCWSGPPAELPVRTSPGPLAACGDHAEEARRLPELVLDSPVRSSSDDEALNLRAQCRQEAPVTRSYRFTPPQTATYRLRLRADEPSALWISTLGPEGSEGKTLADSDARPPELRVTLREGDSYAIGARLLRPVEPEPEPPPLPPPPPSSPPVDVHETRRAAMEAAAPEEPPPAPAPAPRPPLSTLELVVQLDDSADARIRPEDPARATALIAHAPRLASRALGTFESVPGGLRARCGGLGGSTAYAVELAAPARLALHAIAQFPVALEIRDRTGGSRACAHGEADPFEASLAAQLPAGVYAVIVDTAGLSPGLFDQPRDVTVPGAGVRGGFALDAEVTP